VARIGRSDVVLALVGTDPDSETGRVVIAQHPGARLIGRVPIAQVRPTLAAAHVVVVPQRDSNDTRGQVPAKLFLTRWPSGDPIVSTRVSMIPEILEGCGLVEPGDVAGARRRDHPAARSAGGGARPRRGGPPPRGGALQLRVGPRRAVPAGGARARPALAPGSTHARMKLGLICRPFSFHGGIETATAGLLRALRPEGHAVPLISTRRQPYVPGVPVRRVPVLRHPSTLRLLSFALAAQREAARRGYDLVQSHERALRQDLYRAGEGCHRAYLAAMGRRPGVDPYHRLVCALERRIFRLRAARRVVAISAGGQGRDRAAVRHRAFGGHLRLQRCRPRALPS
jgi:glycosyltransferase involved in cell wall biosynthesis